MENKKLLSLCIPTNGIMEWVVPVIESIYNQNILEKQYEIIITDNGNNQEFEAYINNLIKEHQNLIYKKTNAQQFLNQIEAFRLANGEFIKFINHRMPLVDGAIQYMINYVNDNRREKPITYFLNGALEKEQLVSRYDSFDKFVYGLSYFSSWSAGFACWKEDFEKMCTIKEYNLLFPHITLLFFIKDRDCYCIDNHVLQTTLPTDESKKGTYNLFYAFGIEYISTILDLMRECSISYDTFRYVWKQNGFFLSILYVQYVIRKKKSSYDLKDYKKYLKIYYSMGRIRWGYIYYLAIKVYKKIAKSSIAAKKKTLS